MSTTETSLPFHMGRRILGNYTPPPPLPPMIAFGTSITKPDVFRRCAEPGIVRVAEPDSLVLELPAVGSIFKSYNALLDRAAEHDDLEALVLVHQDTELVDHDFCEQGARRAGRPGRRPGRLRRRHRRALHRLVGGVGHPRVVHQPLRGPRRRRPARRSPGPGTTPRPTRTRARWRRWTGSCSSSRRGSCATCASTRASASSTATTSTTACRCARPAARSSPPTSGPSTTGRWR